MRIGLARRHVGACCAALCVLAPASPAAAVGAKKGEARGLERKQFSIEELSLSTTNVPLHDALERLPNRAAWEERRRRADSRTSAAYVDARSGAATNIMESVPLSPGKGTVDAAAVAEAVLTHVRANADLLGIDVAQLGDATATRVRPPLWFVNIAQRYRGVPVRYAVVSVTVSHGNLISMGATTWGNVALDPAPRISAEEALEAGFRYADGREQRDEVSTPRLEIVPIAPLEHQAGRVFAGPIGQGYRHRLVWTFEFTRPPEIGRWEVTVDAHSGEVIAFGDVNHYATRKRAITGGVYPLSSTGSCTDPATCGFMQPNTPMPFANFSEDPVRFANSAGIYDYAGGTTGTRLSGARVSLEPVEICDAQPPAPHTSPAGVLALGGANGQHDCQASGPTPWNVPAARTVYYEASKVSEMAAGYLPFNDAIRGGVRVPAVANAVLEVYGEQVFCNALSIPSTNAIKFLPSGGGCRSMGEIPGVVHHEWAHFLDRHDATGSSNGTAEGYADIAAIYRTQQSCHQPGVYVTNDDGCGQSPDGTGANANEAAPQGSYCTTNCSGLRDADWMKHVPSVAADPLGFVCTQCEDADFGVGPCGKQRHCAATPVSQAAWDFVARDLVAPPYNLDRETAFIVGNKLFYQGGSGVGEWFLCTCGGTADGCHENSGYKKWLKADDDNYDLDDGTPHMTAIFVAFARHGIACPTPIPQNGGCANGPTAVASLTVVPRAYAASLSWTPVPNATRYWVFRTEGHAGCNYGKALIAEVTGLTYVDREVAAGRPYYYNVVAVGADDACFSRVSPCVAVTPGVGNFTISCSPGTLALPGGPTETTCSVTSLGGFSGDVDLGCVGLPSGATCHFSPSSVTVGEDAGATSQLSVTRGLTPEGSFTFKVRGTPPVIIGGLHQTSVVLNIGAPGDLTAVFDKALRVPACSGIGRSCDTGPSLVRFRDGRGPEPNQPNTRGVCPDGQTALANGNGSNDRIRVATGDGLPLAAGKSVGVTATVQTRADFASDVAEFFFAADADNPVWQLIEAVVPTAGGTQQLTTRYVLPAGGRQALRVVYRRQGTAACTASSVNDADDLVFTVGN